MNNIEMILKLMEPYLDESQYYKLERVLTIVLKPSQNTLSNEELIEKFIQHKKLVGMKKTSIYSYTSEFNKLRDFLEDKNFTNINTSDLKEYLQHRMIDDNISSNTLQTNIHRISSLFDFLVNEEYMERNPTKRIEKIMVDKKLKKPFTYNEINILRDNCTNIRDKAIVEFLYSTGCRISECLSSFVS